MFIQTVLDGVREKTSSKGSKYAEVYIKGVDEDGTPDFVQRRFMCFDEVVIERLEKFKKDDLINLDLEIREATIVGIGV